MHRGAVGVLSWALAAPLAAAPQGQPPVFGTQTTLIHVDVLVTDKKGSPVTDLQPEDFEIESNGKRFPAQIATYISAHDPSVEALDLRDGAKPRVKDVRRVVTFLFALPRIQSVETGRRADRFRTSEHLVRMLQSYVDRWREPGDLVGIVSVESQRPLLNRLNADPVVIERTVRNLAEELAANTSPALFTTLQAQDPIARYDLAVAAVAQEAVDRMAALPGRKLLFMVAPTLRIQDQPGRPMSGFAEVRKELDELVRRANRSGVAIHGVRTSPPRRVGSAPSLGAEYSSAFSREVAGTYFAGSDAVSYLTDRTGGTAFRDIDSVEEDLARVMERNRSYYLLGYDEGREPDDQPRKIKVRVRRSGTVVTTRPVVFPDRTASLLAKGQLPARTLEESIDSALGSEGLDVRITARLEPARGSAAVLEVVVSVGGASGSTARELDVLLRVRDEQAETVKLERTLMVSEAGGALKFTTRVPLPSSGVHAVDVAVQEPLGGRRGSASLLTWAP